MDIGATLLGAVEASATGMRAKPAVMDGRPVQDSFHQYDHQVSSPSTNVPAACMRDRRRYRVSVFHGTG